MVCSRYKLLPSAALLVSILAWLSFIDSYRILSGWSVAPFLFDRTGSTATANADVARKGDSVSAANEREVDEQLEHPVIDGHALKSLPLPTKIRHLRIPKAGSSSFSAFLRLQYRCVTPETPPGDCNQDNIHTCPNILGCYGHFPPIAINTTDPIDVPMVTLFRDPVERYISAYNYPGHHNEGTRGNITRHVLQFPAWNNSMTNFFSSRKVGDWGYRFVQPPNKSLSPLQEQKVKLRDALALLKNENRVTFVGLVEYWYDSIRLFCRIYDCPFLEKSLTSAGERRSRNVTVPDHSAQQQRFSGYPYNESATMKLLQRAHNLDYTLFQSVQRRFCADLFKYSKNDSSFRATLSKEVKRFCTKQLSR